MPKSGHGFQATSKPIDFEVCFGSIVGKLGIGFDHLPVDPEI